METYGFKQSRVASMFGVTDAAISQYLKNKRGGSSVIENSEHYNLFEDEIKISAKLLAEEKSDISIEMCRICTAIKAIGLLAQIYTDNTGTPAPKCAWGDHNLHVDM